MRHGTALIEGFVHDDAQVWPYAHVREGAYVDAGTTLSRGVYIDRFVRVGKNCKIGNYACVYWPARLGDGVFVGPHAVLTNDKYPRAVNEDGSLKSDKDWEPRGVVVEDGASVGAGAVIVAGVRIGRGAMIGAGAVVTRDVPPWAVVCGSPARTLSEVAHG